MIGERGVEKKISIFFEPAENWGGVFFFPPQKFFVFLFGNTGPKQILWTGGEKGFINLLGPPPGGGGGGGEKTPCFLFTFQSNFVGGFFYLYHHILVAVLGFAPTPKIVFLFFGPRF